MCLILLTACPYKSYYAINDKMEERVQSGLLGIWQSANGKGVLKKMRISKANAYTYTVKVLQADEYINLDYLEYHGYTATLGRTKIFYAQPVHSDVKEYYYFKYDITSDSKLIVEEVDATAIEGFHFPQSGKELKSLLSKIADDPAYFMEKTVYIKFDH